MILNACRIWQVWSFIAMRDGFVQFLSWSQPDLESYCIMKTTARTNPTTRTFSPHFPHHFPPSHSRSAPILKSSVSLRQKTTFWEIALHVEDWLASRRVNVIII